MFHELTHEPKIWCENKPTIEKSYDQQKGKLCGHQPRIFRIKKASCLIISSPHFSFPPLLRSFKTFYNEIEILLTVSSAYVKVSMMSITRESTYKFLPKAVAYTK